MSYAFSVFFYYGFFFVELLIRNLECHCALTNIFHEHDCFEGIWYYWKRSAWWWIICKVLPFMYYFTPSPLYYHFRWLQDHKADCNLQRFNLFCVVDLIFLTTNSLNLQQYLIWFLFCLFNAEMMIGLLKETITHFLFHHTILMKMYVSLKGTLVSEAISLNPSNAIWIIICSKIYVLTTQ